jgi:hypothetical protein
VLKTPVAHAPFGADAVAYLRHFFADNHRMCEMKRAAAREEEQRIKDRFASTIVIIAAVHLARDQNISWSSTRLVSVLADCIGLSRMIVERVLR